MEDNTYLAPAGYQAFHQRNYQHAIDLFTQRIDELQHVENKEKEIQLLKNDAAVCHILLGDTDKALDLLEQCLAFFKSSGNSPKVAMTLANIATAHEKNHRIKEAIGYYNQALANFPSFEDNDLKYFIHHNLSLLYMRKLMVNRAILERFKALDYKQYLTLTDKLIQLVIRAIH